MPRFTILVSVPEDEEEVVVFDSAGCTFLLQLYSMTRSTMEKNEPAIFSLDDFGPLYQEFDQRYVKIGSRPR